VRPGDDKADDDLIVVMETMKYRLEVLASLNLYVILIEKVEKFVRVAGTDKCCLSWKGFADPERVQFGIVKSITGADDEARAWHCATRLLLAQVGGEESLTSSLLDWHWSARPTNGCHNVALEEHSCRRISTKCGEE